MVGLAPIPDRSGHLNSAALDVHDHAGWFLSQAIAAFIKLRNVTESQPAETA